jgi:hypothetical protein
MKRRLIGSSIGGTVFWGGLAGWWVAHAAVVDFTIDTNQSSITLTGSVVNYPVQEQGPGSLTTKYVGTIRADVTDASIVFPGGSAIKAQNSGNWEPKANGESGSDPANYGATASLVIASANAAVRNVSFDVTTIAPLTVTGGSFDSASLLFQFLSNPAGALDYSVTGLAAKKGSIDLTGITTNAVTTKATLTTNGNTQTLTIPVSADFLFKLLAANDTQLTLAGQLVATRTIGGGGNSFESWVAAHFPGVTEPAIIGPGADPDQDGIPNLVEFAFGLNPTVADPAFAPLKASVDSTDPNKRTLEFIRPKGLSGVSYLLQVSDALPSDALPKWSDLAVTPEMINDIGGGLEKVVVPDNTPVGAKGTRFVLLSVGKN